MPTQPDYNQTYEDAGAAWNVDPSLLRAMAAGESGGQGDTATSRKGAEGRMQFIPATARGIGITDTRDSEQSIWGAAKLMSQNLDASKGDVNEALRLYQGGPNRAGWGKENAAYPAYIMSKYKAAGPSPAPANDAPAPAAPVRVAANGPSAFDAAFGGGSASAPVAASASSPAPPSAFDAAFGPGSAPPVAPQPAKSGIMANVLTGLKSAGEGTLNVLSDPFGNFIGKPLGVAGVFAHDAIAPMFGGQRFTPEQRDMLLSDNVPQPGTRFGSAVANAMGGVPEVTENSLGEKLARAGASGLAMGGVLGGGNRLAALVGAAGGAAGTAAEQVVPDYAAPMAGLAGNIVGGGLAARAGGMALPNRLTPAAESAPARVEPRLASAGPAPAEPVTLGGPQPGMGAPGSMGAAATPASAMDTMTVREAKARRATDERTELANPTLEGRDEGGYIPGVEHTAASVTGNSDVAALQKSAFQTPGQKDAADAQQRSNNSIRKDWFRDTADDPVINERRESEIFSKSKENTDRLWSTKTEADASPTLAHIDGVLNGPQGEISAVADNLNKIRAKLFDSDGKLKTDPERLAAIREELSNIISSKDFSASSPGKAGRALLDVKDSLDSSIESGAPGWTAHMKELSDGLAPINASRLLQNAEKGLMSGVNDNMTFGSFDRFMNRVVDMRAAKGANDYKNISDAQMDRLFALHKDLALEQRGTNGGKVPGSDTNMLGRVVDTLGNLGLHGAAAAAGAVVGLPPIVPNVIVKTVKDSYQQGKANRLGDALRDGVNYPQPPIRNRLIASP